LNKGSAVLRRLVSRRLRLLDDWADNALKARFLRHRLVSLAQRGGWANNNGLPR
jgi:hypothetical protein